MATKSTIQSLINANLADDSDILASEHRAVENQLLNEFYGTVLTDTDLGTTNVITRVNTNYNYRFNFSKAGRNIAVNGSISNATASVIGSFTFANITTPEYSAIPSVNLIATANDGTVVRLAINGTTISYVGNMQPNKTYYFNGVYHAQN